MKKIDYKHYNMLLVKAQRLEYVIFFPFDKCVNVCLCKILIACKSAFFIPLLFILKGKPFNSYNQSYATMK